MQKHICAPSLTQTFRRGHGGQADMGAIGAAKMILKGVFHGGLSLDDTTIERRPYHRNCSCALHKLNGRFSGTVCYQKTTVSFPKRVQAWRDHCLSIAASKCSIIQSKFGCQNIKG